ncbi:alpha/beta hydrolase [Cohaesibacter marisflavi]|uniref:alpha/beta hydrolase n=1 Tax=Cohaesibacter marisflavi TaxID=655353 RepID=UPI0029C99179|nr:alpha/beta hydrolase [Cohaesibacter marisflavi]
MKTGSKRQRRLLLPVFLMAVWAVLAYASSYALPTGVPEALAEDSHVPLEPIDCPAEASEGQDVVCFLFHVPSDWNDIANRPMELPVMRFAPLGPEASKPPLLILAGGPGQSAITLQKNIVKNLQYLREDREIILMDQRGTGPLAEDMLCPEALGEGEAIDVDALVACVKTADADGVRLSDYRTAFAVEDYRALRYALRIGKWAIIASSYGARVAQGLVRRDNEGIDRILFNGPLFLATRLFDWKPEGKIDDLIDACNEDDDCRNAFPDLYWDYQRLPFAMRKVKLAEDAVYPAEAQPYFYQNRLNALLARNKAALVPADIAATVTSVDKALAEDAIWTPPDPLPQSMKRISLLMHFAVACAEEIAPLADQSEIDFQQPLTMRFYRKACDRIAEVTSHTVKLEKGWDKASKTARPTLILNGAFDTIVYPDAVADSLPFFTDASWVTLPFGGHDVLSVNPCARTLAGAFLAGTEPEKLDTACAQNADLSFLLTPQLARK